MEAPTQALILRPFFPDLAAEAAEGGIAAQAAGTISIAEYSAISGEFGPDLVALGVALSAIEQYHSDAKDWKSGAGVRQYKRRGDQWQTLHLIGCSTDIACVAGLNSWFLRTFLDRSFLFCFLLVVVGKATINGKHVYPGSYMVLTPHDPAEVSGDELLTVVVHFMPASCVKSNCPEAPSKLQEVLASKKNADVESKKTHKRLLQQSYDDRRRKPKQQQRHQSEPELPVPSCVHGAGPDAGHQGRKSGSQAMSTPQPARANCGKGDMDTVDLAATSMAGFASTDQMATRVASAGAQASNSDDLPEATRVASESTRVPSQVVHRVWMVIKNSTLDLNGEIEKLPSVAEKSLASFAKGFRQMLWTWQPAPVTDRFCNCERRNADLLLSAGEVRQLLKGGVHVAQIKDVIQMRILCAYGVFLLILMSCGWVWQCQHAAEIRSSRLSCVWLSQTRTMRFPEEHHL